MTRGRWQLTGMWLSTIVALAVLLVGRVGQATDTADDGRRRADVDNRQPRRGVDG